MPEFFHTFRELRTHRMNLCHSTPYCSSTVPLAVLLMCFTYPPKAISIRVYVYLCFKGCLKKFTMKARIAGGCGHFLILTRKFIIYNLFHPILGSLCSVWIWTKMAFGGRDILVIDKDMHQIQVNISMKGGGISVPSPGCVTEPACQWLLKTPITVTELFPWQTTTKPYQSKQSIILGPCNYIEGLKRVRGTPAITSVLALHMYLPLL